MTPGEKHRITDQVEAYIAFKRGLGFQLSVEAEELRRFATFARVRDHAGPVTVDLALNWVTERPHFSQWYRARRLEMVRRFAIYAQVQDPVAEIPPRGLFGSCHGRTVPYVFTLHEVQQLMAAADTLASPDGLRAQAVRTAIGLLWATGQRPSDLVQLRRTDLDRKRGTLRVAQTKFNKERILPLDATVWAALDTYEAMRDRRCPAPQTDHVFLSTGGDPLSLRDLEYAFTVVRAVLLPPGETTWSRRPPRLYDLRHSFACHTL
jgi:site-specific recombinase XerD